MGRLFCRLQPLCWDTQQLYEDERVQEDQEDQEEEAALRLVVIHPHTPSPSGTTCKTWTKSQANIDIYCKNVPTDRSVVQK